MNTPNIRVIPRLDVKGPNVVKGVQLEGLRVVGSPAELARKYYAAGADELLYIDVVASLYGRNSLLEIVEQAARELFIPLTVGGGIRTLDDIDRLLRAGADKIAINTAATRDPGFISRAARRFGSQCVVGSIEAKRGKDGSWEALTDNGREKTGLDAVAWAARLTELGAGEILVTSVDCEGTGKGFDLALTRAISRGVRVPVIASGGAGTPAHVRDALVDGSADAVAVASLLHYERCSLAQIKDALRAAGLSVRRAPAQMLHA